MVFTTEQPPVNAAVADLMKTMAHAGIVTRNPVVADGKLHRVHVDGDKPSSRNGWYVLFADGVPAGKFGCWRRGISETWSAKPQHHLSAPEKSAYQRQMKAAAEARDAEQRKVHAEAAERAAAFLAKTQPVPVDHPYLARKGIRLHGLRLYKDLLAVPARDVDGKLWSLQFISTDGAKRFLTGGRTAGCFHIIGAPRDGKIVMVCEGYATGASIHEATGHAVVVAFSSSNLKPVATAWSAKLPNARFVVAADNDQWTDGNPGFTKATEAARAVGGIVVVPNFREISSELTDFNDLHQLEGIAAVQAQIATAIRGMAEKRAAHPVDAEAEIAALAQLPMIDYGQRRKQAAKRLGVPVAMLDAAVAKQQGDAEPASGQGRKLALRAVEPWPQTVDGVDLLDELARTFTRFLALPKGVADALALWVLHTHAFLQSYITPRLAITSPAPRCGKTTCLRLIGGLAARPLMAANITASAMFRAIEMARPCLLVDEADSFLRDNEEIRGIVNSGHARDGAVIRNVGDNHEPREFCTWAPVAIACIGKLPGTIEDRSVVVPMRRRRLDERIERLRLDRFDAFLPLARKCARWTSDRTVTLAAADPEMPVELHDRACDNWRPLLAIADAAGGEWPRRAREAAVLLSVGEAAGEESLGVLLLGDIRGVFANAKADQLSSTYVAAELGKMEHRAWADWKGGNKVISAAQMARVLRPFKVEPKQVWIEGKNVRGYALADFDDAFARYGVLESARPLDAIESAGFRSNGNARADSGLALPNGPKAAENLDSSSLALREPALSSEVGEWTG